MIEEILEIYKNNPTKKVLSCAFISRSLNKSPRKMYYILKNSAKKGDLVNISAANYMPKIEKR
ncbi:MAG: hypothetical protein JW791_02190 [Nanoarchaeota archaeon]|nr:hypothetical protein [Nanoarchaeota archaeon]